MPRLPSSSDVNVVPIQRDPGVSVPGTSVPSVSVPHTNVPELRVPQGAFSSAFGDAATAGSEVLVALANVAEKQQNRRETVDRSDKINAYGRQVNEELMRLNVESDLSHEETLDGYGQFLSTKRQEMVNEHKGTEDSKALLSIRLQEIENDAVGKAAGISTRLGREKVLNTYNDRLNPLLSSVARDPSQKNIDRAFMDLETNIGDLSGAFDPGEEENLLRRTGQEQIALSAVNSLITRGRVEEADSLMQGGLIGVLSPELQGNVVDRIETIRFKRDEFQRKSSEAEVFLGRPLNENEKLGMLGIKTNDKNDFSSKKRQAEESLGRPLNEEETLRLYGIEAKEGKLSERQQEILNLVDRGISPNLANDIASGNVKVSGPDQFGNFYRTNIATNEKELIPDKEAKVLVQIVEENVEAEIGNKQQSIKQATEKGTGPFAQVQAGISNVIGPFVEGALFEDTTESRQQLNIFKQTAKTALVNNPKFPVSEQELVANLLPDPDKFFKDPDTARSDLKKLEESLQGLKSAKEKQLSKTTLTTERRGELTDQISRIDEIMSLMKGGEEAPTVSTQEEFDALPSGAVYIENGDKYRKP